jgi:Uma2 family endonuclease
MNLALKAPLSREGPRPARFTVDEFLALDATGVFEKHGRTELIQGEIYIMGAQHRRHARIKAQLARELENALADTEWTVLTEVTVSMAPDDAPEPDIVVTNDPEGDGPVPLASVGLIVEISDSSLAHDLGAKCQSYARSGVREYWVVDVEAGCILVHAQPLDRHYPEPERLVFGEPAKAKTFAALQVATNTLR